MAPETRELALAFTLGLLAGPTYLLAGPDKFLAWYALALGAGVFSTAHWLKEIRPSRAAWLVWLAWPPALLLGAVLSLALAAAGLSFFPRSF